MKNILVVISLLIALSSCSKSPKCWGENRNKGIITSGIGIQCEPQGREFIISDQSTYQRIFPAGCNLPDIDFNSYTLLGVLAKGGCEIKFIREVTANE